jgi:trans-aconitate methyltransferase
LTAFDWSEFFAATRDQPHWPRVEQAAALVGRVGNALDLGCGAGRDTRYLLTRGWHVTAVDGEAEAIALLADLPSERLRTVQSSFEDFVFEREAYDLVSAQFTLPFVPQPAFGGVFKRLRASIKPGGVFTGQFFGVHDEWNTPERAMTFLTREEVDETLSGLIIKELTEDDRQGGTATGGTKHWHVFHIIAQKG